MDAKARYDELVDDALARHDSCEAAQMMGMPCVKKDGKMVAGFSKDNDEMVVKLPSEADREAALALDGAHLFDPSGKGRPFKEWVAIPYGFAERWPHFFERALLH